LIKDSKVNSFGFVQNYLGKSITHSVRSNKIKREKRVFSIRLRMLFRHAVPNRDQSPLLLE
jgi:hypothetical protein